MGSPILEPPAMEASLQRIKPLRKVSSALGVQILHVFGLAVDVYMGDGHAVLGQGTGFIGADHADSAQGLYSGQAADNGVDLDHPLDTQGQNDGHNSRQALGDGGYRQGDCGEQHLHDITLLPYGDAEQRHTDEDSQAAQKLAQGRQDASAGGSSHLWLR